MRSRPLHQPLSIWSVERKMPQRVAANDVIPWADTRKRRIDDHEFSYPVRILGGKGISDHIADVVRYKIDFVDLQRIEHAGHVLRLGLLVVTAGRPRGQPEAAQVRPITV